MKSNGVENTKITTRQKALQICKIVVKVFARKHRLKSEQNKRRALVSINYLYKLLLKLYSYRNLKKKKLNQKRMKIAGMSMKIS